MADLDLGTIAVDSKAVKIPVSETIYEFTIGLTRSDLKRREIIVKTTERQVSIAPASEQYVSAWAAADAMLATPEGVAFLASLKAGVEEKPLKLSITKEVVNVEA